MKKIICTNQADEVGKTITMKQLSMYLSKRKNLAKSFDIEPKEKTTESPPQEQKPSSDEGGKA